MPEKTPRQTMPAQDPLKRIHNFDEVALGYTEEQAVLEASRCLGCKKNPCVAGCPVEIDISGFIQAIKEKDFEKSLRILKDKNNLPAICGRVCPQETQCEQVCVLGKKEKPVAIGRLERFIADWDIDRLTKGKSPVFTVNPGGSENPVRPPKKDKVAVIGSGPAGLTCAADLARMGYPVKIFESLHAPGGVLRYGIPEFRLPKKIVDTEIDYVRNFGVEIEVDKVIGRIKTLEDLKYEGYRAFFIGTGAGLPYFMGIEGENLCGVYSANEFLTRVNLMRAYDFPRTDTPVKVGNKVAVIGAGNVAVDAARCARRLGAEEVAIVYRRSEKEMPARDEEIEHAREEGIKLHLLTNPTKIIGDDSGWVKAMECIRNKLGEPDASGRRRPVPIPGTEFIMEVKTVVCAIGQGPNPLLLSATPGLKLGKRGNIEANEELMTSIPGVFAGGDIVTGAATVIEAMGAGKKAARSIDKYLS